MPPPTNRRFPANKSDELLYSCSRGCAWACLILSTFLFCGCVGVLFWVVHFSHPTSWAITSFIIGAGGLYVTAFATSVLLISRKRNTDPHPEDSSNTQSGAQSARQASSLEVANLPLQSRPLSHLDQSSAVKTASSKNKTPPPPYEEELTTKLARERHYNSYSRMPPLGNETCPPGTKSNGNSLEVSSHYEHMSVSTDAANGKAQNCTRAHTSVSDTSVRCSQCVRKARSVPDRVNRSLEDPHNTLPGSIPKSLNERSFEETSSNGNSIVDQVQVRDKNSGSRSQAFVRTVQRKLSDSLRRSLRREARNADAQAMVSWPLGNMSGRRREQRSVTPIDNFSNEIDSHPVIKIESPSPPSSEMNSDFFQSDASSVCSIQPDLISHKCQLEISPSKFQNNNKTQHRKYGASPPKRNEAAYSYPPLEESPNSKFTHQVSHRTFKPAISPNRNYHQKTSPKFSSSQQYAVHGHYDIEEEALKFDVIAYPTAADYKSRSQCLEKIEEHTTVDDLASRSQHQMTYNPVTCLNQPLMARSTLAIPQSSGWPNSSNNRIQEARSIGTLYPPASISVRPQAFKSSLSTNNKLEQRQTTDLLMPQPFKNKPMVSQKINFFEQSGKDNAEKLDDASE